MSGIPVSGVSGIGITGIWVTVSVSISMTIDSITDILVGSEVLLQLVVSWLQVAGVVAANKNL